MVQAYDTGLALPQRTLLRNAVQAKLAPLLKANGLYLATIGTLPCKYKGEHDEEGLDDIKRTLQGGAPAILIALGDATFEPAGMTLGPRRTAKRGEIELYVYAVTVHGRDMVDGRLQNDVVATADVTKDPGIETILEHVKQLLQGQDLGVDSIYQPDITDEKMAATFSDMTIWEHTYVVQVDVVILPLLRTAQAPQPVVGIDSTVLDPDAVPAPQPANPFLTTQTELDPP